MRRRAALSTIGLRRTAVFAAFAVGIFAAVPAVAHYMGNMEILVVLHPDRTFTVEVLQDVRALMFSLTQADIPVEELDRLVGQLSPEEREIRRKHITDTLPVLVEVWFDGAPVETAAQAVKLGEDDYGWRLGGPLPAESLRLTGAIPRGAKNVTILASMFFGNTVIQFREEGAEFTTARMTMAGMKAEPYQIKLIDTGDTEAPFVAFAAGTTLVILAVMLAVWFARRRRRRTPAT
ncbi:hypothetical protein K8I61_05145 [bacterium]|nr:hypothetical protein [bacterium]